jgi:hypothetical protein
MVGANSCGMLSMPILTRDELELLKIVIYDLFTVRISHAEGGADVISGSA